MNNIFIKTAIFYCMYKFTDSKDGQQALVHAAVQVTKSSLEIVNYPAAKTNGIKGVFIT